MIDVLHLIDTYRIGGPGKTIINSARFIDRSAYRVHVAAFLHPDDAKNDFAHAVAAAGIPLLPLRETSRFPVSFIGALRAYVRREGIRIVHPHGYRSDAIAYVATRRLPGVAVVTTHHGWIRNSRKQDLIARGATQLASRFDGLEVVSGKLFADLPARLRRRDTTAIVHNGIVVEDYARRGVRDEARARFGLGRERPVLGVVGRLSVEKGVLEMVDAFTRVRAAGVDADLVFAGDGPLAGEIVRLANGAGVAPHVHLVGHQARVQDLYEALDVVVVPSRTEGICNVILEALTMGVPVVATRVGGTPEIIDDAVSGVLVPSEDPGAMAAALLDLLRAPARRDALVAGGRARIDAAFSFPARMRKEEALYQRVLAHLR